MQYFALHIVMGKGQPLRLNRDVREAMHIFAIRHGALWSLQLASPRPASP